MSDNDGMILGRMAGVALALGLIIALVASCSLTASADGGSPHCPCPAGSELYALWEWGESGWILAEGSGVAVHGTSRLAAFSAVAAAPRCFPWQVPVLCLLLGVLIGIVGFFAWLVWKGFRADAVLDAGQGFRGDGDGP